VDGVLDSTLFLGLGARGAAFAAGVVSRLGTRAAEYGLARLGNLLEAATGQSGIRLNGMPSIDMLIDGSGKLTSLAQYVYRRPSGYRAGVEDTVWNTAVRESPDGLVRDPLTGTVMSRSDPWQMGHRPRYEFADHQLSAAQRGASRDQFLTEHNNPAHYRPELKQSNVSHRGEDRTSGYLGP
jgi:hypothetical protein